MISLDIFVFLVYDFLMKNTPSKLEELQTKYEKSEAERLKLASENTELATVNSELADKNLTLETQYRALSNKNEELAALIAHYEARLRLSCQRQFGQSSEKSQIDPNQMLLIFDEAENEAQPKKTEPTVEEITYTRRKRTKRKEDKFEFLPVEQVTHSIAEEERVCPECGEPMHIMGHETRKELFIIPAQVKVLEHIREIYSCRRCERENTKVPIVKAPMLEAVIKGSAASAAAIAHIMVQKYINAVPLYRQEISFLNDGFFLSRQTMANWLIRASSDWLEPLYRQMHDQLLQEDILHADETVVQVLKEPGRASRNESYMWLYCTGRETQTPIVLYEYQETRSSTHPKKFLGGYKGYLHADGYAGYKTLQKEIHLCGCWAHARRKFHEALKSMPTEEQANSLSQKGLAYCDQIFALERSYEQLTPQERHTLRTQQNKPIADAFFKWASEAPVLPKSILGKAIHYAMEQKPYLETYYNDGRLEISNNRAERAIKPFVIGRKNWLFSCTPKGAKASAVIYSILETAKQNGLKPYDYLKYIFETMPSIQQKNYHTLLPWSASLPDYLRTGHHDKDTAENDKSE